MKQKCYSFFTMFLCILLLSSCGDSKKTLNLPEGFELVRHFGNIFFIHVSPPILGDKKEQKKAARHICKEMTTEFCEIYMWGNLEDVPQALPIRGNKEYGYLKQRPEQRRDKFKCLGCVEEDEWE